MDNRDNSPIKGVVYGLYRASDDALVEYLETDRYGVALSSDVPIDNDYYLLEYSTGAGYLPNSDRKDIRLTEICAPSRVDLTAGYDPILGRIKVIKTDEQGYLLKNVGFHAYDSGGSFVETIYTNANGEALTNDLYYGFYDLYEFQGLSDGGYYGAFVSEHEETVELHITNYYPRGYAYIYKTGNDGRKVQGAVFSLYTEYGEWIEDITTSSSGYAYTSDLLTGDYYLIEKNVPAPYVLDSTTKHSFSIHYNNQSVSFTIENKVAGDPGKLKIIKTDDSEAPLSGVVFGLYRTWDNKKIGELTTAADGTITSGELIPGDYYITELSGKTGYTMHSGQIPFTIDGSGETVEKTVVNPKTRIFGKVKILKQDDAGTPLSSVRFGVYCHLDNLLEEITTGSDGTAISAVLNEGEYYLKELEGLAGYVSSDSKHPFSISENDVVVPVNITNPRITGGIKIIKTGSDEQTPLAGVVFGVYRLGTDDMVCELTTDASGTATSDTLFYGDYELREISTLDGYELIATAISFSITEQNVIIEIPVSNPLIFGSVKVVKTEGEQNVEVVKVRAETVTPLPGAIFGLYNGKGQKIGQLTTDENGEATRSGLPKGEYFLKELVAPEGFVLLEDMIPFSISEQAEVVEIVAPNAKGFGTLDITKYGEEEVLLPGVQFEIYRESTSAKVEEITTDENGTATIKLPLGRYYLKEIATAEGYALLTGTVSFALTADGVAVKLPLQNQKAPVVPNGTVQIIKKSAKDGAVLKDAIFGLYRTSDDEKMAELTTNVDGTALSPALPEGSYCLKELVAPAGFELSTVKTPVAVKKGETVNITLTNKLLPEPCTTGVMKLVKKAADTNRLLPGAKFGIYKVSDDAKVSELTTESDGTAVSSPLPAGEYYLLELTAPEGFALRTDKIPVTIKKSETVTITVTNIAKTERPTTGFVKLIKKADETGKKLPNAVFGLYKSVSDEKVAELTTGSDGTVLSEALPEGDYYLKEIKAPSGFRLSTDKTAVHIRAGQTVEITITNYLENVAPPTAKLKIIKKADVTRDALKGAAFGLYKAGNDEKVAELTTDSKGEALSPLLPAGDYYLKELKAPTGFKLNTDKISVTLKTEETLELALTNTKLPKDSTSGTLSIIKKAERTWKLLPDAVFGVYKVSGNTKISEVTTADDGTASIELEPGDYYLKELRAPTSYIAEQSKIPFTIKTAATVTIEVTNTKGQGTVKLIKTDNAGKPLAGGVFSLYRQDGRKLAELISKSDGAALYELPIGAYYLVEKTAPVGFILATQKHSFTIENGKTAEVKVVNQPILGTVEVYFKHQEDGRELAPMQTYTDKIGADYIKWMRTKGYENMPIDGFQLIRTDYPTSLSLIDGKLVVTLWYGSPQASTPDTIGGITIPKTGETPPYGAYMMSLFFWLIAAFCGMSLFRNRQPAFVAASIPSAVVSPVPPIVKTPTVTQHSPKKKSGGKKKRRIRK